MIESEFIKEFRKDRGLKSLNFPKIRVIKKQNYVGG